MPSIKKQNLNQSQGIIFVLKHSLKGVFAKNERGYNLNAIKKRF